MLEMEAYSTIITLVLKWNSLKSYILNQSCKIIPEATNKLVSAYLQISDPSIVDLCWGCL